MLFAQKNEKSGKIWSRSALPKAKENLINRIWYETTRTAGSAV